MFESKTRSKSPSTLDAKTFYDNLEKDLIPTLDQVWFTNLSNTAAVLWQTLPNINWVGFYLSHQGRLWLGPFQGLPACLTIDFSRGVCGHAATIKKSVLVDDVEKFAGHITCDSASKSELVIPLIKEGRVLGVLDIDSPTRARFTAEDQLHLERVVAMLVQRTDWPERF